MFDKIERMDEQVLWQLGDTELLDALRESQDQMNREYGGHLALLGEVLNRGLVPTTGYRTAPRLLQDLLRISQGEANRRLAHAAAVTAVQPVTGPVLPPPLPATAEAVRAGAVGPEHVEVIRRVITALPPEVDPAERELAERTLAEAACTLDPGAVGKLGRTIKARLDQDGQPPSEAELRNPINELRWTTRRNGEIDFRGRLGAEGAELLTTVLGPLAKPRPAADGERDARSHAERYGDALVDLLRLAANSGQLPNEGGERPTLLVTIPLQHLRDQLGAALLGDTTLIDARMARRMACDCTLIPAVLGANSEPLDIGRKTRIVPIALRRALFLRDHGCAFPGCPISAVWCDAHHCAHWADGGPTALSNLVLLCGTHHALIHHSDWEVVMPNGIPEFIPPPYIDPDQRPRRNTIHQTPPHHADSNPPLVGTRRQE
jgi:hypothetical protein